MPKAKKAARPRRKHRAGTPPVPPPPAAGALLVAALDSRWEKFLAELRRNRRRCTEPSIHDLRVATRRMIAALDVLEAVLPGGAPQDVRRKLKRLLKGFNDLRDLHIQLLHFQSLRQTFPVVQPFLSTLRIRELELVREAARTVADAKTRAMEQEIARAAERLALVTAGEEAEQAARVALFGALAGTFLRAAALRKRIAPADPASIHALRVAFKKFRYTVEVLAPLVPTFGKEQFKAMNSYQTCMGEIQDLEVVTAALSGQPPGRLRAMPASLLPVRQSITQRRTDLVERFVRDADELLTFWNHIGGSANGTLHSSPRGGGPSRKQ